MRLYVPLALGVLFSLGCGLFAKKDDSNSTDTDVEDDGVEQSQVCADYLSCAASASPDSFSGLSAQYGPASDCWDQGQDHADDCTTVCESGVADLARANPQEEDCADYAPPFALIDDYYLLALVLDTDRCDVAGYLDQTSGTEDWIFGGAVYNDEDASSFTWNIGDAAGYYAFDLDCTNDDREFFCSGEAPSGDGSGTFTLELEGVGEVISADGTWTLEYAGGGTCKSSGDFTAEPD